MGGGGKISGGERPTKDEMRGWKPAKGLALVLQPLQSSSPQHLESTAAVGLEES